MPEKALLATVGLSFAASVGVFFYSYNIKKRFERALGRKDNNHSLEETLKSYFDKVNLTAEELENIHKSYTQLTAMASSSIQKISVVRFNPFSDTGGDQSFAMAVLDYNNNGFLLTSIHSREGTRVYVKPIEYGASQHSLSEEERNALDKAMNHDNKENNYA